MTDDSEVELPLDWEKQTLEKRKAWAAKKLKSKDKTDYDRLSFEEIVFPDAAGLRKAALVVCSHSEDAEDARVLLNALAILQIMAEGGDGRRIKKQRGKVFKDDIGEPMIGYGDD